MSQESLNSNNPWENEELTEAELDALAGGFGGLLLLSHPFNDSHAVLIQTDNLFTSFVGAPGTTDPAIIGARPMNLSLAFP